MTFLRHVKVTLWRAKDVNACTGVIKGVLRGLKARTIVTAKASYKNLLYTTSPAEDMGKNPEWEDGTSVFHFKFRDNSNEFITLELFNRNNDLIGVSKLYFSALEHLAQGRSEMKTLPVMVTSNKQFGELILEAEILEQQVMGDRGLLMVKIQKGQMIQKIVTFFGSKTTKIKAKLTYKHTTFTSGVLEDRGNIFIWHEDNDFTFIINTDVNPDRDALKIEVYNGHTKVGECEMLMSLFLEENLRGRSNDIVTHKKDLSHPNKSGAVGHIEVGTNFIPKPISPNRRSSFPGYSPYVHNSGPSTKPSGYSPRVYNSGPFTNPPPEYTPSAPFMHAPDDPVGNWGAHAPPGYRQPEDDAAGAPAGPSRRDDLDQEQMNTYMASFH